MGKKTTCLGFLYLKDIKINNILKLFRAYLKICCKQILRSLSFWLNPKINFKFINKKLKE